MKAYLYLAAVLAWGASLAFVGWKSYDYGQVSERDKTTAAVVKYQEAQVRIQAILDERKKEREADRQNTIRVIRESKGGCADSAIDPPRLRDLLLHDR